MSKYNFLNLDNKTREYMFKELIFDINGGKLYISDRLNDLGKKEYENIITESIKNGDEFSFSNLLKSEYFNKIENRKIKNGIITCKIPANANEILASSEFNRYYIRGVCLRAIDENVKIEVYRAKDSNIKREESELKIGQKIEPDKLLLDLRKNIGVSPEILPEINSGLSAKLL